MQTIFELLLRVLRRHFIMRFVEWTVLAALVGIVAGLEIKLVLASHHSVGATVGAALSLVVLVVFLRGSIVVGVDRLEYVLERRTRSDLWLFDEEGQLWLVSEEGRAWLSTPKGKAYRAREWRLLEAPDRPEKS